LGGSDAGGGCLVKAAYYITQVCGIYRAIAVYVTGDSSGMGKKDKVSTYANED
jgi:hypothetical protein